MLSTDNIRRINRQIENELRTVNGFITSDEDKMEAIKRIAALKALLETPAEKKEQPLTRDELVSQVAREIAEMFRR